MKTPETAQPASLSISIPGNILSTNAEDLRTRIFGEVKQANSPWQVVEIDLRRASMVDSVGLNLLVAVIKHVRARNGAIRLVIGNHNVERTFRFTRLDSQAEIVVV